MPLSNTTICVNKKTGKLLFDLKCKLKFKSVNEVILYFIDQKQNERSKPK